jgi:hypothetical protein
VTNGLERVIEAVLAAARLLGETEFVVVGSQAFYGTQSALRPNVIVKLIDVDLLPRSVSPGESGVVASRIVLRWSDEATLPPSFVNLFAHRRCGEPSGGRWL